MHLPDNKNNFQLFSDTSKTAAGTALYQIQTGPPNLLALTISSNKVFKTELEILGLCVNVSKFKHLLANIDIDYTVDHLTVTYIMKVKTKPASARLIELLKILSAKSFNLLFMELKDLTLSNFISRIKVDKSNPYKIIPISFDCC